MHSNLAALSKTATQQGLTQCWPADDPRRLLDRTAEQDLEDKELEIRFGCCMASLTILRCSPKAQLWCGC